jgi:hypothetical protein
MRWRQRDTADMLVCASVASDCDWLCSLNGTVQSKTIYLKILKVWDWITEVKIEIDIFLNMVLIFKIYKFLVG